MAAAYGTKADIEGVHRLRDGRILAYAEFGDPRGRPVFYFHGLPGSRLEGRLLDRAALREHLRVIAPDRPGFGRSDFKADRTIADWPGDVMELADSLGLESFAVVGNSGGSPYAAACARYLGPRLTGTTLICGLGPVAATGDLADMAPWIRLVFRLAGLANRPFSKRLQQGWAPPTTKTNEYRKFVGHASDIHKQVDNAADSLPCDRLHRPSFLLPPLVALIAFCLRHFPEQALTFMALKGAAPDRQVLREPMVREVLKASFRAAARQGGRGGVLEMQLFTRPWGFRLEDISSEVQLWFGGLDRTVPSRMGEAQAAALPNCRRRYYPEEGHFSLPVRHIREILAEVR